MEGDQENEESFLFIFCLYRVACEILVPRPGIELKPSAVKVQSPNHWTTRESPKRL